MFQLFLPKKGSLPEITLEQLEGYKEDNQTADHFEKKGKWRLIVVLLLAFGPWGFAAWVKAKDLRETQPYRQIEIVSMYASIPSALALGIFHVNLLSRRTPISLRSGKPMERFLRADPPFPVKLQMVYVCHTSKTYFRRNYLGYDRTHMDIR